MFVLRTSPKIEGSLFSVYLRWGFYNCIEVLGQPYKFIGNRHKKKFTKVLSCLYNSLVVLFKFYLSSLVKSVSQKINIKMSRILFVNLKLTC